MSRGTIFGGQATHTASWGAHWGLRELLYAVSDADHSSRMFRELGVGRQRTPAWRGGGHTADSVAEPCIGARASINFPVTMEIA
jgi:hypothetical protein